MKKYKIYKRETILKEYSEPIKIVNYFIMERFLLFFWTTIELHKYEGEVEEDYWNPFKYTEDAEEYINKLQKLENE